MSIAKENMMAFDIEFNQPSGTIIQIGAVVGNIYTGEILKKYSQVIHTKEKMCTDPEICDIPKLTGITDKRIFIEGIPLFAAYQQLKEIHKEFNCFRNPITWGGGDTKELKEQVESATNIKFSSGYSSKGNEMFFFGFRFFDAKTLMQSLLIKHKEKIQGGLARSLTKLGMKFEGKKHDAKDDALNTFRIYNRLLETMDGKELL